MNEAKRLDAVAGAAALLDEGVHVAIVGRRIEGYDAGSAIEAAGLTSRVSVHADVSGGDFLAWLAAADAIVDLRFPHRGEVSGSLSRAMQAGKPSVVSATGTYLDLPDDAVVRVAPGATDPAELAAQLARLARRSRAPRAHRAGGGRGTSSGCATPRPPPTATNGRSTRRSRWCATRRARPSASGGSRSWTSASPRRWSREGYGMEYARALRGFEPSSAVAELQADFERSS